MSFADQKAKAQADAAQVAADLAKVQQDEAIVAADIAAITPDPIVVTGPAESPDGTIVANTTARIITASGKSFGLTAIPGQVLINEVVDNTSGGITKLVYSGGKVIQGYDPQNDGTIDSWWIEPEAGGPGIATTNPLPTPPSLIVPKPLAVVKFQSDFTGPDFAEGGFDSSALAKQFLAYSGFYDTSGSNGYYSTQGISKHDGLLDLHFVPDSQGRLRAICLIPDLAKQGSWSTAGFTYGQTDIVLNVPTADALDGWIHPAWMLWPMNNNWPEGEADGLETNLNGDYAGFLHALGANPAQNIASGDSGVKIADGKDHLWTQLWTPQGYWSMLDGVAFISYPFPWATTAHRLTIQTESNGKPPVDGDAHVLIKSVTVSQSS